MTGAAQSSLTVGKLFNEGTIRIAGGTITQSEILPSMYLQDSTVAVHDLSQAFSIDSDGTIQENAASVWNPELSNAQLAATSPFYLLGKLGAADGIVLAPGSVTDLSGTSIVNPRPSAVNADGTPIRDGILIAGGTLQTLGSKATGDQLFAAPLGLSDYSAENPSTNITAGQFTADAGAVINLAGTSDTFDEINAKGSYAPTLEWSDGGTLALGNGGSLTGAIIDAHGGARQR